MQKCTKYGNTIKRDAVQTYTQKNSITKLICIIIYIVVLFFFVVFCLRFSTKDDLNSFENYLEKNGLSRALPSGADNISTTLVRDKYSYYVVVNFMPYLDENIYAWAAFDRDTQIKDMKFFANIVIDYTKSKKWDNDYCLYITVSNGGINFVYDYETDTFYYPKDIEILTEMYNEFETMNPDNLLGQKAGERFLINNGMCKIKYKEIKVTYTTSPFIVCIYNGKLKKLGPDSVEYNTLRHKLTI